MNQRGSVALLMVLITLAIITTLVIEIMYKSKVSATIVTNRRDGEKAYELARSAVRWSIFRLQLDNALDQIPPIPMTNYGGRKDDLTEIQWAIPLPYPFSTKTLAAAVTGSETESAKPEPAQDLGGSFVSAISDESSRLNLNDVGSGNMGGITRWSGAAEILENLLLSPRFKPFFKNVDHRNVLWAIDDWIDIDSEVNHTGGGIEDVEYQTEDRNLHVKNGPFYSIEELRLLKPITDDIFSGFKPFITVYPFDARLPKISTQPVTPMGMINVNTAPLELLAATFNRTAMPEWKERLTCAQALVKFRKNTVFRSFASTQPSFVGSIQQLCRAGDTGAGGPQVFSEPVKAILSARSDTFSVEATGSVGDLTRTIATVISRQNAQKPKILYWKVM